MTMWFGIVPALRAQHRGGEPGPGYAVLDDDGELAGHGRLVLANDGPRHLCLDVEMFAQRVRLLSASRDLVLVLERHVRAPKEFEYPFAAGRDVGAIEGFAQGFGLPLLSIPVEEWRDEMLTGPRSAGKGERAIAAARGRWPSVLSESRCPGLAAATAEAALLAAYAREHRCVAELR